MFNYIRINSDEVGEQKTFMNWNFVFGFIIWPPKFYTFSFHSYDIVFFSQSKCHRHSPTTTWLLRCFSSGRRLRRNWSSNPPPIRSASSSPKNRQSEDGALLQRPNSSERLHHLHGSYKFVKDAVLCAVFIVWFLPWPMLLLTSAVYSLSRSFYSSRHVFHMCS